MGEKLWSFPEKKSNRYCFLNGVCSGAFSVGFTVHLNFKSLRATLGKFQQICKWTDGHFGIELHAEDPTYTVNSLGLHQSQKHPLEKVGWTCRPQSTTWRRS